MIWAAWASTESLWLDELHTSWAVSGAWSDVASRARQGNQSPLFFWALYGLRETLGNLGGVPGEPALRLPAIVCWGATLFFCVREVGRIQRGWVATIAILVWMLLDRIQLFYATEARVYATVQIVSLLGWIAISRIGEKVEINTTRRDRATCIWLWCGLSILLVFLHITAALAVGWQVVCGTWLVMRRAPQRRFSWFTAVSIVVFAVGIALLCSAQVWEHRQQWSSFAGEASLVSLVGLFPLLAYVVPVAVARGLEWVWERSGTRAEFRQPRKLAMARGLDCWRSRGSGLAVASDRSTTRAWMWWVAIAGPWLSGWCITAMGIAPVFHRRFVIVAAMPLIVLAALELSRVQRLGLRWSALVAVAAWLIVSQGTLDNWRARKLFGWQRTEGWRQASEYLNERVQSGDQLWCASGLIEGHGAELPLSESLDRYLSFPLRGLYGVVDRSGESIEPRALVGDGASWSTQLCDARRPSSGGRVHWIVYRGSPTGFEKNLHRLALQLEVGSIEHWQIGTTRAFGMVSVVRVSRD